MDSFENVHVFSQTTAEISQEYIDKFHEAETVPNYLQELSHKAGVELVSRDGVYEVKGSWLSVNRAHSFLGKFLLTYGQTRVDTLNAVAESTLSKEEEEALDFLNRKTFAQMASSGKAAKRTSSDSVDNGVHIDQRLPPDKMQVPKSQPRMPPEPVVLYAGYQVSKEVETRRKTLEVLKNVYKMEQNYQVALAKTMTDGMNLGEFSAGGIEEASDQFIHNSSMNMEEVSQGSEFKETSETGSTTFSSEPNMRFANENVLSVMTKLKEDANKSDVIRTTSSVKTLSKEETAAKRKKVESIAENILSNVPTKETVNVVSIENTEQETVAEAETPKDITELTKNDDIEVPEIKPKEEPDSDDVLDVSEEDTKDDEESDFKDDLADKDYSGDTEVESADEEKKPASDNEYVPEEKVKVSKLRFSEKRTTRRSKNREELKSLPSPKRGRGRPRKGFPMKLEVKLPTKTTGKVTTLKARKTHLGVGHKKRGRPKKPPTDVPKEYHCDKCPYFANKRCHLREHERRVHITKEFKCEHCDKIFGFGKDLRRHLKTHLKPQNCCDICGKMYKGMKSLVEHRHTHDDGYVKPEFECEICKKNFSTKYVLAYHIKSEHLGMKRTFMCPTCGKSFSQKNSYLQHANVHMGFKPYKCEVCGKAFSYEKSLKEHRFMHDDIRRFKCPVCDKTFRQSSAVTIHMKVHKETKDYVCMACGKGFSQKQALIRHERIHLGEKPFSCGLCGRNFTDSSILRRHMILIHKKDPKKWREDTINNTVRRTDFFIDVLPGMADEEQDKDVQNKETDTSLSDESMNLSHPELMTPTTSAASSEPLNMSTQGSARERVLVEEFHGEGQSMHEMAPDPPAEPPYHLSMSHEPVAHAVSQENPTTTADKMTTIQNHSALHPGAGLPHHSVSGLPPPMDCKSEGGEYLPGGMSPHGMPYPSMMGQGVYPYPQMVMMPDPNVQYPPPPSSVAFQTQYSEQSTSHPYPSYHPPQS